MYDRACRRVNTNCNIYEQTGSEEPLREAQDFRLDEKEPRATWHPDSVSVSALPLPSVYSEGWVGGDDGRWDDVFMSKCVTEEKPVMFKPALH